MERRTLSRESEAEVQELSLITTPVIERPSATIRIARSASRVELGGVTHPTPRAQGTSAAIGSDNMFVCE